MKNSQLSAGPCSCANIYNAIRGMETINGDWNASTWQVFFEFNFISAVPEIAVPETTEIPLDKMYPPDQLDLIALWCTLTKTLYIQGNLEAVLKVCALISMCNALV